MFARMATAAALGLGALLVSVLNTDSARADDGADVSRELPAGVDVISGTYDILTVDGPVITVHVEQGRGFETSVDGGDSLHLVTVGRDDTRDVAFVRVADDYSLLTSDRCFDGITAWGKPLDAMTPDHIRTVDETSVCTEDTLPGAAR